MTTLTRNDIPTEGSEMWRTQWDACTGDLMEWLDSIKSEYAFDSVWSLWNVRDFTEVPFPGATHVTYMNGFNGKSVGIQINENASWLDLWKAADTLITDSGDRHHVFIEKFKQHDNGDLSLTTGS